MTSDPFRLHNLGEDDFSLSAADVFSERSSLRRCNSVHGVQSGPWRGTLVCCARQDGHRGEHSVLLGDVGTAHCWQETW
jgi:hypothetical protein